MHTLRFAQSEVPFTRQYGQMAYAYLRWQRLAYDRWFTTQPSTSEIRSTSLNTYRTSSHNQMT